MDVHNAYFQPQFVDEALNRRLARLNSRSKSTAQKQYKNPYGPKRANCEAESFRPFINPISKEVKESWDPCNGKASNDDILCSVHRKMLNNACAHGGLVQSKTNVRVPFAAIDKGGCAFPAQTIAEALKPEKTTGAPTVEKIAAKTHFTSATKFEINDQDAIRWAFALLHGKE